MFNQALSFRKPVWYWLVRIRLDPTPESLMLGASAPKFALTCSISDLINVIESRWQHPSSSRFAGSCCSWFVCETQGAGHGWLQRHIGLSRLNSRRGEEDMFFVQECESFGFLWSIHHPMTVHSQVTCHIHQMSPHSNCLPSTNTRRKSNQSNNI